MDAGSNRIVHRMYGEANRTIVSLEKVNRNRGS